MSYSIFEPVPGEGVDDEEEEGGGAPASRRRGARRRGEAFAPAVLRARADGWTARRQHDFIEMLADTGSVSRAALAVGMSRESAYRLRRRADGRPFADAWRMAQVIATERLADACLERAIHGEQVPIMHNGEIIGHRVRHSDALAIFLLKVRDPLVHGALALPPRSLTDHIDTWVLNPIPRALKALPKLLGRLLGEAPAAAAPAAAAPVAAAPVAAESHERL